MSQVFAHTHCVLLLCVSLPCVCRVCVRERARKQVRGPWEQPIRLSSLSVLPVLENHRRTAPRWAQRSVVTAGELVGKNFIARTCQQEERKLLGEELFSVSARVHLQLLSDFQANGSLFLLSLLPSALHPHLFSHSPSLLAWQWTLARPGGVFAICKEKKENLRREANGEEDEKRAWQDGDGQ